MVQIKTQLNQLIMTRRQTRSTFAEPLTKQLGWDVEQIPVVVEGKTLINHQAIVRNDNRDVLAVTKKSYHPATNERFLEVISRLHEFTGFGVEGYSVFHGGRKVLAFLKNSEKMRIGDFDSENYMVVGNSFDCSTGFFTGISNVVIRCTNQFSRMSVQRNIRHNKHLSMKLDEMVLFYKRFVEEQASLQSTFEQWNEKDVTSDTVQRFVNNVLDITPDNISTMKKNQRRSLMESVGTEMDAMGHTKYGLFNGLTHYTTHVLKSSNKTFGGPLGQVRIQNARAFWAMDHL
jgi:hypothetical protein